MSYARRAAFGSGWTIAALIFSSAIAYLLRVFLTRSLSVEDYGLFFAAFNFIILFLFFRDMGLNAALAKFIPEYGVKGDRGRLKAMMASVLLIQLGTSVILCLALLIGSKALAIHYFKDASAVSLIFLFTVYVILSVFLRFLKGAFVGFKSFFIGAFLEPLNNLAVLALTAFFLAYGSGVLAPAIAYVISLSLSIMISIPFFLSIFNPFKEKITGFGTALKDTWLFGLPMMVASFGGQIIGYMDTVMLTFFSDLETVGIYNVILPSALLFLIFGRGITTVMIPIISELRAKGQDKAIAEGISMLYKYSLVFAIPLISAVLAFPGFFLLLFFGKEYVAGAFAFQVLLVGVLFYIVSQINESVLVGIGKPGSVTKITLVAAALNILLNLFFIPRWGIIGAALATSASYVSMLILTTRNIRRGFSMRSPVRQWSLALVSGIAYVGILIWISRMVSFSPWIEVLISVASGLAVYACLVVWLRVIDVGEIRRYAALVLRRS